MPNELKRYSFERILGFLQVDRMMYYHSVSIPAKPTVKKPNSPLSQRGIDI
jgi:hypothetical protein